MDDIENELLKAAADLAAFSKSQLKATSDEITELQEQLLELKAKHHGQIHAEARLETYRARLGESRYSCPHCWIVYGQARELTPIHVADPDEDIMRCHDCGHDFSMPGQGSSGPSPQSAAHAVS